jgi:hypothetical protein
MASVTFDTLKFANQLKTAGVPAGHAEAEAKALSEIFETNLSELATKADLREVEIKIEKTELALRQEMSNLKFELLKWLIGLAIAQAGLLVGLKFLP